MSARSRRAGWLPAPDHVVVYAALLLWWVVGPAYYDDGWVATMVENYHPDGDYGNYFVNFNGGQPLFALQLTMLRMVAAVSTDLIWLRVPTLLAGIGTWHVARSAIDLFARRSGRLPSTGMRMRLAGGLLLGWVAWNMSLRGEPFIALLSACGLWAAMRFGERPHGRFLLVGALAAAAGILIHPAGMVVLAPWIPLVLPIVRWVRVWPLPRSLVVVAIVLVTSAALLMVMWGFQGTEAWSAAVDGYSAQRAHSYGVLDEYRRYGELYYGGNAVRRLAVMLPAIGAVMFLAARRQRRDPVLNIPLWTAVAAVPMLAFVPSKWMWHFGALASLAAVALACEWALWREQPPGRRGRVWTLAPLGLILAFDILGWYGHPDYGPFDWVTPLALSEVDSTSLFEVALGVLASPLFWVGLLVVARVSYAARHPSEKERNGREPLIPWLSHATSWLLSLSIGLAVLVPVSAFTADGLVLTSGWSLAKQNVAALAGATCGLADEMVVMDGDSSSTLQQFAEARGGTVFVPPQVRMYFPCLDQPTIGAGVSDVPNLVVCVPESMPPQGVPVDREVRACTGWPFDNDSSPHAGLLDVALLEPLPVTWPNRTDTPAIFIASVTLIGEGDASVGG